MELSKELIKFIDFEIDFDDVLNGLVKDFVSTIKTNDVYEVSATIETFLADKEKYAKLYKVYKDRVDKNEHIIFYNSIKDKINEDYDHFEIRHYFTMDLYWIVYFI